MKENKKLESGYYSLIGLAQKKLGETFKTESDALRKIINEGYEVEYNKDARRPFYNIQSK